MKGQTGIVFCLLLASAPAAAAPKKDECIAAFDKGQRARREGHLKEAKESLLLCSQQECPTIVRADCVDVLRQVDAAQPTIVLKAADAKGTDLTDVSVELNGTPIAASLDGRAIAIDPGKHALVFKRPPWEPVTINVVIADAEKNRIVTATLGPPAPAQPAPVVKPLDTKAVSEPEPHRSPAGWIVPGAFAALGLGALAFGGITRLGAGSDADDLKARCGPTCPSSERDRLSDDLVTANVALFVGLGSLAVAAVTWFVLAPSKQQRVGALTW